MNANVVNDLIDALSVDLDVTVNSDADSNCVAQVAKKYNLSRAQVSRASKAWYDALLIDADDFDAVAQALN